MEETTIDLKKYWLLLKRWAWLLILGLLLGAAAGFGFSKMQTPVYQAMTKVMVTRGGMADQSLDTNSYSYPAEVSQTYLQLLQTNAVLSSAAERLGIGLKDVRC